MNKYEKLKKIGKGSYGSVYLIKNIETAIIYCLKKINLCEIKNKIERDKATQEVEILKMFNSDYIVKYFDSFFDNYSFNFVMEYCSGGELTNIIRKYKENGEKIKENVLN